MEQDFDGAIAEFDAALRLDPEFALALRGRNLTYRGRALTRWENREYNGAIADLTEAIRVAPDEATLYSCPSSIRAEKADDAGAIADLTETLRLALVAPRPRLDPRPADAAYHRGFDRAARGDFAGALAEYDEAIRLNPDAADPYIGRAWVWATCPDAGIRDGKRAVESATSARGLK